MSPQKGRKVKVFDTEVREEKEKSQEWSDRQIWWIRWPFRWFLRKRFDVDKSWQKKMHLCETPKSSWAVSKADERENTWERENKDRLEKYKTWNRTTQKWFKWRKTCPQSNENYWKLYGRKTICWGGSRHLHSPRQFVPLVLGEPPIIEGRVVPEACGAAAGMAPGFCVPPLIWIEHYIRCFGKICPWTPKKTWSHRMQTKENELNPFLSAEPHLGYCSLHRTPSHPRSSWLSLYWAQWQSRSQSVYWSYGSLSAHLPCHLETQLLCVEVVAHQILGLSRASLSII